jgi:hypothetical protein
MDAFLEVGTYHIEGVLNCLSATRVQGTQHFHVGPQEGMLATPEERKKGKVLVQQPPNHRPGPTSELRRCTISYSHRWRQRRPGVTGRLGPREDIIASVIFPPSS